MFTLNIQVSSDVIAGLKGELARTLPNVKSSHRCEAIARGMGFRTYASFRAAVETSDRIAANASGAVFVAYLADHGFDVSSVPFYRAVARTALRAVLETTPNLTRWGIGVGRPRLKSDRTWETWRDVDARFAEQREGLLTDDAVEQFLLSLALLARVKATKTIRKGTSSYRLKHIAENYVCTYPEGQELGPQYVPNGAFIAAALHAGFKMKGYVDEFGVDDLNVNFNMSKAALDDLDCEIRPDGSRAQERQRRREARKLRFWPTYARV